MSSPRLASPSTTDWDFPRAVAGVRLLVEHGLAHGMNTQQLLAGTGLRPEDLERQAEVTARQELRVVRHLRGRLGDAAAREVGRRYRVEAFGAFGFAMVTSRTVLDAVNVALRFIDLSFAFAIPVAAVVGDRVVATLDGSALPSDVRTFLVHRDATAVHTVLEGLVPGGVGAVLELGPQVATLEFDATELSRPVPQRDARSLALARSVCESTVSARRARSGLTQDVRVLVTQRLADGAPMGDVARELGLSERALRRRLAADGVGYRQLLDEVRSALAVEMVSHRASLPLEVVAERLGYSGPTALIHAFRRWTGETPRRWAHATSGQGAGGRESNPPDPDAALLRFGGL